MPERHSCAEGELRKNGYIFDVNVDQYLPLLEPKRTKAGIIAARQPKIAKQPGDYWRAQCAFRNLSQAGTIAQLQKRLRHRNVALDVELSEKAKKLEAEVKEREYKALVTNEQKAQFDPNRFLNE